MNDFLRDHLVVVRIGDRLPQGQRVINTETDRVVETHRTIEQARRACEILNDHEIRNRRTAIYAIRTPEGVVIK